MSDYWNYYDDNFDWDDKEDLRPNIALTLKRFGEMGFSSSEAQSLLGSGYVFVQDDVIVDRYYGGLLASYDHRTRFPASHFVSLMQEGASSIPVASAGSIDELLRIVEDWQKKHSKPVLFRGQTSGYPLEREHPNPFFRIGALGEISLVPSLWRGMLKKHSHRFHEFRGPMPFEWSTIIYSQFDLAEVERREEKINASGGWIHSAQDMEDSDDPLLKEFGRVRLDLMMGYNFNLADQLNTLLQHYGLHSPVLDLTSDLDVALFFAFNRMRRPPEPRGYQLVSGKHRAVLYVFKNNEREMRQHFHDRVLRELIPLRPERQACFICRSGPYALNLAADFLIGVIQLSFQPPIIGKYAVADLFPDSIADRFLDAIKRKAPFRDHVMDVHGFEPP